MPKRPYRQLVNDINARAERAASQLGTTPERITARDIQSIYNYYPSCLHPDCANIPTAPENLSIDHVTPLDLGGANNINNLQTLCVNHNKGKRDTHADYRPTNKPILTRATIQESNAETGDTGEDLEQNETTRRNKHHDWAAMEHDYITTNQSQRQIAAKNELDPAIVGRYASENDWALKRQQFISETSARLVEMVANARAENTIAAMDLCDSIIAKFMREMVNGRAKITAFDAMAAARFREVLRGGVDSRSENINKDWRDFAKDEGLTEAEIDAEFDRIAAERDARQAVSSRGAIVSRTEEERGAGWTD